RAVLGITGDWRTKELVKHIINNDVSAGVITINSVNSDGLLKIEERLPVFNRLLVWDINESGLYQLVIWPFQ
ncbi:unnamed protein product, partial [marine sediment metagenome]